uniref:F-box protein 6 n=1 Tax=Buteo japonicus TaxID=224669 RepID=A0A8C0HGM3_9AVES
ASAPSRSVMTTICDLPEDVLVELLSLLPAQDLIRTCRLVCTQWRYVVDLTTLWKRKCQREGFYIQNLDRSVSDWKIFYMLCSLKRNLIKNPSAEENFQHWKLDNNEGDKWKIEDLPGTHGKDMPDPKVHKYFVTSYGPCFKSQLITLQKEGYWNQLMDEKRPEIVVKDWYAARFDCGCRYELTVRLLSEDYIVLEEFHPEPVVIEQWNDSLLEQHPKFRCSRCRAIMCPLPAVQTTGGNCHFKFPGFYGDSIGDFPSLPTPFQPSATVLKGKMRFIFF